jgi:NB-ARC domain/Trypsin-like peptidase domain
VPYVAREGFTVRVLRNGSDAAAGVGFVVGDRHIVTCAHVVNTALGRGRLEQGRPAADVRVPIDFPILSDSSDASLRSCRVAEWAPPPVAGLSGGDVAGLVLVSDGLPAEAGAARLIQAAAVHDMAVRVFGYPSDPPRLRRGAWAALVLRGAVGGGDLQLDAGAESAIRAQPGYSGSPAVVADEFGDAVVGMFTVAGTGDDIRDAYAMPTSRIAAAWPDLLGEGAVSPHLYSGPAASGSGGNKGRLAAESGPAPVVSVGVARGPREAAQEVAKVLMVLDNTARGIGISTYSIDALITRTVRIGGYSDPEVRRLFARLSERGLDARVLIPQATQHEEAVRRWAAPLPQEVPGRGVNTPLAMLASFTQALAEELSGELFTALHKPSRDFLIDALRDVRSVQISVFVRALDGCLPPLRSISREAVLWRLSPHAETSDEAPGNSTIYRQLSLNAIAAQMCRLPDAEPFIVGRAARVGEVVRLIGHTMAKSGKAVAFLAGQPGVGTSTVAIEAARSLIPMFPGGVCYVNLRGLVPGARRDARTVARLVSGALELQLGSEAMDDDHLFAASAAQLAGKHVLLVLDDAQDARHVAPLVHAPPTCCIIVTSRDRLQDYASPGLVFPVTTLDRSASVELLAGLAGERAYEPSQLHTLAHLCDDLPLALRLIGARITSYPDLDLGYLASILEAEVSRLKYLEAGERGMRAAIQLSYANLDSDGQDVFRLIAAAPGSMLTGTELAYCLSESPSQQELVLNRLVDRSLADHNDIRTYTGTPRRTFTLFELVRLFAMERLADVDGNHVRAFQRRSVTYLRDRLREIVEDESRADLSGELDPARFHAAEHLADEQEWLDLAKELVIDLHVLYLARREIDSILAMRDLRIRLHLRCGEYDNAVSACLLNAKGLRDLKAGFKALSSARKGRDLAVEYQLPVRAAEADFLISVLLADQGDWARAFKAGERAASALMNLGHEAAAVPVAINNCRLAFQRRAFESALRWGRTATDLADRHGSTEEQASAALNRGFAERRTGNQLGAIETARRAGSLFETDEDWWNSAVAYQDGAYAAGEIGLVATEIELLNIAADRWERSTDDRAHAQFIESLIDLSSVLSEDGSFEQAFRVLERASDALRRKSKTIPALMPLEVQVRTAGARFFLAPGPPATAVDLARPGPTENSHEQKDTELERILVILRHSSAGSMQATAARKELSAFLATRTRHRPDPVPFSMDDELGELTNELGNQIAGIAGSGDTRQGLT